MSAVLSIIGFLLYGWGLLAACFTFGMDVLEGIFKNKLFAIVHVVVAVLIAESLFGISDKWDMENRQEVYADAQSSIIAAVESGSVDELAITGAEFAGFIPATPNPDMVYYDARLGSDVSTKETSTFKRVVDWVVRILLVGLAIFAWNWFVGKTGGFWLQLFGVFSYASKRGSGQGPVGSAIGTADAMFFAKTLVPGGVVILLFSMVFIGSSENKERDSIARAHTGEPGSVHGVPATISDLEVKYSSVEAYNQEGDRYDQVTGAKINTTLHNSNIKGGLIYSELVCGWKDTQGTIKLRTRTPLFPRGKYGGEVDHIPPRWAGDAYSEFQIDGFIEAFDGTISMDQQPECSVAKSTLHLPILQSYDWGVASDFDPEAAKMTLTNNTDKFLREIELTCQYKQPVTGQAIDADPATKIYEITSKTITVSFADKLLKPGATFVKEDLAYRHCEVDDVEKIDPSELN